MDYFRYLQIFRGPQQSIFTHLRSCKIQFLLIVFARFIYFTCISKISLKQLGHLKGITDMICAQLVLKVLFEVISFIFYTTQRVSEIVHHESNSNGVLFLHFLRALFW